MKTLNQEASPSTSIKIPQSPNIKKTNEKLLIKNTKKSQNEGVLFEKSGRRGDSRHIDLRVALTLSPRLVFSPLSPPELQHPHSQNGEKKKKRESTNTMDFFYLFVLTSNKVIITERENTRGC